MASNDPLDWIRAREEYLDPLDRRFPDHPYKAQTEAWRDRIDLRDARAPGRHPGKDQPRRLQQAQERGRGPLSAHLPGGRRRPQDPPRPRRRGPLAGDGAATDQARAARTAAGSSSPAPRPTSWPRRSSGAARPSPASSPRPPSPTPARQQRGRPEVLRRLLRDLVNRFERYPDVADLVAQARAGLAASEPATPAPAPSPVTEDEANQPCPDGPAPRP